VQPRTVASADGTPIAFWRSGAGRPLVLVHGTTADHTRWATVLPLLEPHFTVYAVDRRGRGGSGDSSGADAYAIEREFEDVVATVRAVREDARENPILLGHSYGGICSLEAASRIPDDIIDGLILYEPPIQVGIEIYPPGVIDRLDALIAAGEREEALMTFMREIVHVPAEQIELSRSLPSWEGRVAAAPTVAREVRADDEHRCFCSTAATVPRFSSARRSISTRRSRTRRCTRWRASSMPRWIRHRSCSPTRSSASRVELDATAR